jgi:hypothetical protein
VTVGRVAARLLRTIGRVAVGEVRPVAGERPRPRRSTDQAVAPGATGSAVRWIHFELHGIFVRSQREA